MKGLTTNYARLAELAPKRKKRKRKSKSAKLQIVEKPAKPIKKSRPYLTERELLRKLDGWD